MSLPTSQHAFAMPVKRLLVVPADLPEQRWEEMLEQCAERSSPKPVEAMERPYEDELPEVEELFEEEEASALPPPGTEPAGESGLESNLMEALDSLSSNRLPPAGRAPPAPPATLPDSIGLPEIGLAPALLTVGLDQVSWMGKAVATLKQGVFVTDQPQTHGIEPLGQAVEATYEITKKALGLCGQPVPQLNALLVMDVRVPVETLQRIIFTLIFNHFRGLALAVSDPSPGPLRVLAPVGGQSGIGDLRLSAKAYHWKRQPEFEDSSEWPESHLDTASWPRSGPLPQHLGEDSAPTVKLHVGTQTPYADLIGVYDALAGMGAYCVQLMPGKEEPSGGPDMPLAPASSVALDPRGRVAVHLLESPFSPAGNPTTRLDGARCRRHRYLLRMEGPPPDQLRSAPTLREALSTGFGFGEGLEGKAKRAIEPSPPAAAEGSTDPALIEELLSGLIAAPLPLEHYFWTVFAPRSAPAPVKHRYAPGGRAYIEWQVGAKRKEFAARVFEIPRDPKQLRRLFETHKGLLQRLLGPERYRSHFSEAVIALMRVYQRARAHPNPGLIYAAVAQKTEAHDRLMASDPGRAKYAVPPPQNPFQASTFENLYVEDLGDAPPVWSHSFWFRRHQEGNMDEVYRILVDIHGLYGLSPPRDPYSPEGRADDFDPTLAFVADGCCVNSESRRVLRSSDGRELLEVGCSMHAYQGSYCYAWLDGSGLVRDQDGLPLSVVGLPRFDPQRDELVWEEKARGVGGCGDWFRFALKQGRFVQQEHRRRRCDERPLIVEASQWALVPEAELGHCADGEEPLFSCQTSRSESLSLCAEEGRMQFRWGRRAEPELIYPKEGRSSAFSFREESGLRSLSRSVSFSHEGRSYALQETSESTVSYGREDEHDHFQGLRVVHKGRRSREISCVGRVHTDWEQIRRILQ